MPDLNELRIQQDFRIPKRIVIETDRTGSSRWRWVPHAIMEEGVENEGVWPSEVQFCGSRYIFSRDQWDVHVLDPAYDCLLRIAPHCPVITRKAAAGPYNPSQHLPKSWEQHRQYAPPPVSPHWQNTTPLTSQPTYCDPPDMRATVDDDVSMRSRSTPSQTYAGDYEEEFDGRSTPRPSFYRMDEDPPIPPTPPPPPPPPRSTEVPKTETGKKRKASDRQFDNLTGSLRSDPSLNERETKQTRNVSPSTINGLLHEFETRQANRERRKHEIKQQRHEARKRDLEARNWQELLRDLQERIRRDGLLNKKQQGAGSDVKEEEAQPQQQAPPDSPPEEESEEARLARIKQSREKLAGLGSSGPGQPTADHDDEAAKQRRREERARQEAEAKAKAKEEMQAQQEREARLKREADQREFEEREWYRRRNADRRPRLFWGPQDAYEHFTRLSAAFDSHKPAADRPISFSDIPWPILHNPSTLSVNQIDWDSVENFFQHVQTIVSTNEYKNIIRKCRIRFHPDKWKSILLGFQNTVERDCLETAVNTVAQALTPLWTNLQDNNSS
ncbi:hypothetical protein SISSUDRAFT_1040138 [Sistotremastrum suecicum HHB10207 ss-3]|uniref:Uncharacterized protein n=1 Tax=Sistotremastrum suecicum HHB10207 ss-3 TaxID=1314776 RepID=A0A166IDZ6_9AGAM|nr:hypothetical protein SISSUDRAFT_1040138 [Sistotremastrum suecicum HHB10207 ss-3]